MLHPFHASALNTHCYLLHTTPSHILPSLTILFSHILIWNSAPREITLLVMPHSILMVCRPWSGLLKLRCSQIHIQICAYISILYFSPLTLRPASHHCSVSHSSLHILTLRKNCPVTFELHFLHLLILQNYFSPCLTHPIIMSCMFFGKSVTSASLFTETIALILSTSHLYFLLRQCLLNSCA